LTATDVRERFDSARTEAYETILADARALLRSLKATRAARAEHELAKLRRRYETVSAIDFFSAPAGAAVSAMLGEARETIQQQRGDQGVHTAPAVNGATWVTRRDVHVDRIASAWLIRRFIDRQPRFRF